MVDKSASASDVVKTGRTITDAEGTKLVIPVVRTGFTNFLLGVTGVIPDTEGARKRLKDTVERALKKEGIALQGMVVEFGAKARSETDA